jgi:hypothetical protein
MMDYRDMVDECITETWFHFEQHCATLNDDLDPVQRQNIAAMLTIATAIGVLESMLTRKNDPES